MVASTGPLLIQMIDSGAGKYIVPRGDGTGDPIILDVAAVVKAESRLQEVAQVNVHTAAELLSTYNEHWLTLHKNVTMLTYERNRADDSVKRAYAEALLNCNDELIKKKGHSKASQDLREAVANLDPDYIRAKERLNEIKAVLEYMVGKRQAFENAYNSVKKLVATPQLPMQPPRYGADDPFNDRRPQPQTPQYDDDEVVEMPEGFEEPRYR